MMRLPSYRYRAPKTVQDAAAWLAEAPGDTMLLAGGTDLIPNMKRRQQVPSTVVGLRGVTELLRVDDRDGLEIGAGVTLTSLVHDERVHGRYLGLWQAVGQIATPLLRNMGTIGGNICLDTRCTYYDQSFEWRQAINFCMKKDGDTCWVATSSDKCLAVSSTDAAPALIALGATVRLVSAAGTRDVALTNLYANDGMHYLTRRADEILTTVTLPKADGWRSTYWKLRRRGSFDFPVAAVAAAARFDGDRIVEARIVLGAVASRPLEVPAAAARLTGQPLTDDLIASVADDAYTLAKPMDNTDFELVWRKKTVRSLVTSALRELRGDDMRAARTKLARHPLLVIS
ncbi:MAG TPA: FAD binding domain-containing protein [Vicinamibacterales bacterium]|nr:FAD binding domain-containing protein [Vicinamibacterales bacterium]